MLYEVKERVNDVCLALDRCYCKHDSSTLNDNMTYNI